VLVNSEKRKRILVDFQGGLAKLLKVIAGAASSSTSQYDETSWRMRGYVAVWLCGCVLGVLSKRASEPVRERHRAQGTGVNRPEGMGEVCTYVAYTTSYMYNHYSIYLQGAKTNGRGAKEKPSRFSNRMKFKSLFSEYSYAFDF
jgi:hypothetical protein